MQITNKQIAEDFSKGKFEMTFPYLSDDIKWNIAGEKVLKGKAEVTKHCKQTTKYFSEVTTEFKVSNIISEDKCVAIDGTAKFTSKENRITEVSSCDVYRFENGKIMEINSYCIVTGKT